MRQLSNFGNHLNEVSEPHCTRLLDSSSTGAGDLALAADECAHTFPPSNSGRAPSSEMTVAEFIERKYLPEHINLKRHPSRLYYQAILKHVITPDEVSRIFQMNPADPRRRLNATENWPYLNDVRMCEVRHDHVAEITSAAMKQGYSIETIRHIRNAIGTIFSYAIQKKCFFGDNPISLVAPIPRARKQERVLTPDEANRALAMMRYPERELTLIGAISGMTPAEVIGLQWRQINMMEEAFDQNGVHISPMTIAVRKCWYRGRLNDVKKISRRDVLIDRRLLQVLLELRMRSQFTWPEDFVLVSQFGTPINYDNIMTKRLRPIAKCLAVPSVSSNAFRLIHTVTRQSSDGQARFEIMSNQKPCWFEDRYVDAPRELQREALAC